jgi:hypothetical protein
MADFTLLYTVLAVLSVGFFLSRTLLRTPEYKKKSFPVYGPLEIAFTGYAATTNGLLNRIAYVRTLGRADGVVARTLTVLELAGWRYFTAY